MKPILLVPIVVGLVVMPSSRSLDAPNPRSPADLYTRSYSDQRRLSTEQPTAAELRANEYAIRYMVYDEHHEAVQTSGHSGVVAPKPGLW